MQVAISQRVICDERGTRRDALEQDYVTYYSRFGMHLIPIPNTLPSVREFVSSMRIEGILLSGGNDIKPAASGSSPTSSSAYAPERDHTERELVQYALEKKLPILAQCRGAQFLNVFFGGAITRVEGHVAAVHSVSLKSPHIQRTATEVNSYHNFGIAREDRAPVLNSFAETADGFIEGLYHPELPIAGILWHPERQSPDEELNSSLVKGFVTRTLFWTAAPQK